MSAVREKMFGVLNSDGWRYEIGPDSECAGLIEIRYYEGQECKECMSIGAEDALLIGQSLIELAEDCK